MAEQQTKKWRVLVAVDATVSVVVEAATEAEALEKGLDAAERPCICHQCSDQLEVGDCIRALEATEEDDG